MSTYANNLIAENGTMAGMGFGHIAARNGRKIATGVKSESNLVKHARNVALFLVAPFIGLAYLLAFPVVGLALLAWTAGKAAMKNQKVRPIALAVAAPFIAIAFVTLGPIAALVALVRVGAGALLKA